MTRDEAMERFRKAHNHGELGSNFGFAADLLLAVEKETAKRCLEIVASDSTCPNAYELILREFFPKEIS